MKWKIGDRVWYIDTLGGPVFGVICKINKKKNYVVVKSKYGDNDVDCTCLNDIESQFEGIGSVR